MKRGGEEASFQKLLLQVAMAMSWGTWTLTMMVMIDGVIGIVNVVIVMNWRILVGKNDGDEFKSSNQKQWWWWTFLLEPLSLTHTHTQSCLHWKTMKDKLKRKKHKREKKKWGKCSSNYCKQQWWQA
jgi:hypothetical protein